MFKRFMGPWAVLAAMAMAGGAAVAGQHDGTPWGKPDWNLVVNDAEVEYGDVGAVSGTLECNWQDHGHSPWQDGPGCPTAEGATVFVRYKGDVGWRLLDVSAETVDGVDDGSDTSASWVLDEWQLDLAPGTYELWAFAQGGETRVDSEGRNLHSNRATLVVEKRQTTVAYDGPDFVDLDALAAAEETSVAVAATVTPRDGLWVEDNPPTGTVSFDLTDGGAVVTSASGDLFFDDDADAFRAEADLSMLGVEEGEYTLLVTYSGDDFYASSFVEVTLTVEGDTLEVDEPDEPDVEDNGDRRAAPAWANWYIDGRLNDGGGYNSENCFPDDVNHNNANWRGVVINQISDSFAHFGAITEGEARAMGVFQMVDDLCAENDGPPEPGTAGGPPPHAGGGNGR